jgi:hypothetical protein
VGPDAGVDGPVGVSPNGTPVPPRDLRRGDRVTIVLRAGGKRISGKVRSNENGRLRIDDANAWIWDPHCYPHTAIRHAVRY